MVKENINILLVLMLVLVGNQVVAMNKRIPFFIENPFDKKQEDNVQLTLHTPLAGGEDFSSLSEKKFDVHNCECEFGYRDTPSQSFNVEDLQGAPPVPPPFVQLQLMRAQTKRRSGKKTVVSQEQRQGITSLPKEELKLATVFEKNENGEYECPYNCPDEYTHKKAKMIAQHIRRKHDKTFKVKTFDAKKIDLNAYIFPKPRKKSKKGYADVFEKNENGEFECPYHCPDRYKQKNGSALCKHIQGRHDPEFKLQTFNRAKANLNVWIPRKKGKPGPRRYKVVFKKNGSGDYMCPYNCPDNKPYTRGPHVVRHIKRRHDPLFNLQTFDRETANLDAWIPRKKAPGPKKRQKPYRDVFDENDDGEFECPYNNCDYTNKSGDVVINHIKRRHDPAFKLQKFDVETADLNAFIPLKKRRGYDDVFEKNQSGEYVCPYSCPEHYANKKGQCVFLHVKQRHDSSFNPQTFDASEIDLSAWIPRKREEGKVEC